VQFRFKQTYMMRTMREIHDPKCYFCNKKATWKHKFLTFWLGYGWFNFCDGCKIKYMREEIVI
jgi:hypothetical protein